MHMFGIKKKSTYTYRVDVQIGFGEAGAELLSKQLGGGSLRGTFMSKYTIGGTINTGKVWCGVRK
jgi:hypothetical protein